jgi:hypothetical protein
MKIERDIEKRIKQKEEEVQRLKQELFKAEAYLEAMQESLRLIKRTSSTDANDGIRPGSSVYKARATLRKAGKPLHVDELLRGMGKEVSKKSKVSLSGSLGSYVRQQLIFTRPAPNTFGLIEFAEPEEEIPEGFGT